jgi:hypothetical protein
MRSVAPQSEPRTYKGTPVCGLGRCEPLPGSGGAVGELPDRHTEQINAAPHLLLPPSACGKYDVSRQLETAPSVMKVEQVPGVNLLEAA